MSKRMAGTAMVELAILMPLLVILVFGIFELGRALFLQDKVTRAAASGARYLARTYGTVADNCTTQGAWDTKVAEAKTLVAYAGQSEPIVTGLSEDDVSVIVEQRDLPSPNDDVCVVQVRVEFPFPGAFSDFVVPMTNIKNLTLNAQAEEVYIGE